MEETNKMKIDRGELAEEYFKQGFNCSQSVFLAFADHYGIEKDLALKLACSFGGGMGRMRQVCGAVSGMALVCGMECGNTDPDNKQAKTDNYEKMRELAEQFKKETGSIICGELLGLTKKQEEAEGPAPDDRTAAYYKKRPCPKMVRLAAQIVQNEFQIP